MLICKLLFNAMIFLSSYWSNDTPIFPNYYLLTSAQFLHVPFIICVFDKFSHAALSDFYILRKSCNCYFTAENLLKSVFLLPKSLLVKGLCIRMSSIIIELSRQIDFFEPSFPSRPCCQRTIQSNLSSSTSSQFVQLGLITAPLKIKTLLPSFTFVLVEVCRQLVSTISDGPNITIAKHAKFELF